MRVINPRNAHARHGRNVSLVQRGHVCAEMGQNCDSPAHPHRPVCRFLQDVTDLLTREGTGVIVTLSLTHVEYVGDKNH